jgi:hypothetical protein
LNHLILAYKISPVSWSITNCIFTGMTLLLAKAKAGRNLLPAFASAMVTPLFFSLKSN